jgi:hypothetical protein
MQKIISVKPSNQKDIDAMQNLLDDGYKVVFATPNKVAITGRGSSISSDEIEGHIVYILEKN